VYVAVKSGLGEPPGTGGNGACRPYMASGPVLKYWGVGICGIAVYCAS
jgi:hypothetical protein